MAYGQATVTAVTLRLPYPADDLFPSNSLFPDATFLDAGRSEATLTVVVNEAAVSAVIPVLLLHPGASLFPSPSLFPGITSIPATPGGAALVPVPMPQFATN